VPMQNRMVGQVWTRGPNRSVTQPRHSDNSNT